MVARVIPALPADTAMIDASLEKAGEKVLSAGMTMMTIAPARRRVARAHIPKPRGKHRRCLGGKLHHWR